MEYFSLVSCNSVSGVDTVFLMLLGTEVMVGASLRTVRRPEEEVLSYSVNS